MTPAQIETALGQHLEAMTDVPPIAWANKDANPERPFIAFQNTLVTHEDDTLDGVNARWTGFLVLTVVTDADEFNNAALELAGDLVLRYGYGLRITAGAGEILVNSPAVLQPGFRDGPDWRQPVRVDYVTE